MPHKFVTTPLNTINTWLRTGTAQLRRALGTRAAPASAQVLRHPTSTRALKILTWHVHGSYLYYLSQCPHEFYIPVTPERQHGYGGRSGPFPWPPNLHEIPADALRSQDFDCIVFQARQHFEQDQHTLLSESQRRLPRIYIEHDPPREHPTDTRHFIDDPEVLIVQVTHFNDLMWDCGRTPTQVIDHGVIVPPHVRYTGELAHGIVVVNNLRTRGRRLGLDIFERARREVPLDLVGMGSTEVGGRGEVPYAELAAFQTRYRFFFNPIRYTSLGLAVIEAMTIGMPIVGLATTEMVTTIENGVSGYVCTDVNRCIEHMHELLNDRAEAQRLGANARAYALERFNIQRFIRDWDRCFATVVGRERPRIVVPAAGYA